MLAALATGCPAHEVGLVHPAAAGVTLETASKGEYRLVTVGEAAPMAFLDGHTAEVWGTRVFRTISVSDWKVLEGMHGLSTWVGTLEASGVQIGLYDRNTESYYFVNSESVRLLEPLVGLPVLLEGYVEGPHRIRVLYFRPLAPARATGD